MSRIRFAVLLATVAMIAACGDTSTDPARSGGSARGLSRDPGLTCSADYPALVTLAEATFGTGSPNVQSVLGRLNNLQHQLDQGNTAAAHERAHDIVDFTLRKARDPGLPGSAEDLLAFVNGVYCYSGLDITATDPLNSQLIFPDDPEQVVYNEVQTAGVKLPAFPVTEPTLLLIDALNSAPLDTKLDQYPGYINITAQSASGNPFAGIENFEAVVAVCATAPRFLFPDRQDRLRLGHGASSGFEITPWRDPAADGIALQCETSSSALDRTARTFDRLGLESIGGEEDFALFSGGVGGTAREFSPFAPVDVELEAFSGGVGGTAREFLRYRASVSLLRATFANSVSTCDSFDAPIGSAATCRPTVIARTFNGTVLAGVPVDWAVTAGNGSVALTSGTGCASTDGAALAGTTGSTGQSSVCWTMGATAGPNGLMATPGVGGDVPPGAYFGTPTVTFTATASPPVGIRVASVVNVTTGDTLWTDVPGSVAQAGALRVTAGDELRVRAVVVDLAGRRVFGFNGALNLAVSPGAFAGGGASRSITVSEGSGTVSATLTAAGSDFTLTVSGSDLSAASVGPITVAPAAVTNLTIVAGNAQTAAAGTTLPVDPAVRATDGFGNVVPGVTVVWDATLSSAGAVAPSQSLTGADGVARTVWTVGDGANELRATVLGSTPPIEVFFTATGVSTLAVVNSCPVGGSGDPINGLFAFYLPNPGPNRTIESVQLYFSATGKANQPSLYELELTTQSGTFDPSVSVPVATRASVVLRGNASEAAPATFTLSQPIQGVAGGNRPPVMVRLRVLNNPDNATVRFNTGPCAPGTNCRPPQGCNVTEVSNTLPYPLGTAHRRSVAMIIKGR